MLNSAPLLVYNTLNPQREQQFAPTESPRSQRVLSIAGLTMIVQKTTIAN